MLDYRLSLVTAPASEPVSRSDVKTYMRVDTTADDDLIDALIVTARQDAEKYTGRAFISQTWRMFINEWSCQLVSGIEGGIYAELPYWYYDRKNPSYVEVPLAPLTSVTHIKTYDDSDTATTFASSNYQVSAYAGEAAPRGRITLRSTGQLPTPTRNMDGIEIQFVAGYGSNATDVPRVIRTAIMAEVAFRYTHRGDCGEGTMNSPEARALLGQYRIVKL